MVAQMIKSSGGFLMALKNYDGNLSCAVPRLMLAVLLNSVVFSLVRAVQAMCSRT
jgi:hypothetical protein